MFEWTIGLNEASADIVTFDLQIDPTTGDFNGTPFITASGLSSLQFRPDDPLPDDDYLWRARAVNGAGVVGEFSEVSAFTMATEPPDDASFSADEDSIVPFVPSIGDTEYTPTFKWNELTGVDFFELILDGVLISTADGSATTGSVPSPISFGESHLIQLLAVDNVGNRGSAGNLYFLDALTGDDTTLAPNFTVGSGDEFSPGRFSIQVAALDRLVNLLADPVEAEAHKNDPTTLLCRVIDEVICDLFISLDPAAGEFAPGATVVLEVIIDPLEALDVDGAEIFINVNAPLILVGITSGDVETFTLTALDTGDGTVDFEATFNTTNQTLVIATLTIQMPAVRSTLALPNVVFVDSGDRTTVGTFEGIDIPALLVSAEIDFTPSGGGGGGGGGGGANQVPVAFAGVD